MLPLGFHGYRENREAAYERSDCCHRLSPLFQSPASTHERSSTFLTDDARRCLFDDIANSHYPFVELLADDR